MFDESSSQVLFDEREWCVGATVWSVWEGYYKSLFARIQWVHFCIWSNGFWKNIHDSGSIEGWWESNDGFWISRTPSSYPRLCIWRDPSTRSTRECALLLLCIIYGDIQRENERSIESKGREEARYPFFWEWLISFILVIRELTSAKDHRITVDNLSILSVSNSQVAKEYVEEGLTNRRVGVTNMNIRSSRSHAVFTLYITCEVNLNEKNHA